MNLVDPFFSVCIPTYNRGNDLIYTIQSVLDQTYNNWELVICDDSTNNDVEYLVIRLNHPKIVYYKNKDRLGLVHNWNNCLLKGSKDFILLLHHDDLLLPDAFDLYRKYLVDNPKAYFVHADSYSAQIPYFKSFKYSITQNKEIVKAGDEAVLKVLFNHNFACSTVLISKRIIETIGIFDTKAWVSPDFEYYARIGQYFDLHHIDKPTAIFVSHRSNTHISGYNYKDFIIDNHYYFNKIRGYLKNYNPEYEIKFKNILNEAIMQIGINLFINGNIKESFIFFRNVDDNNILKFAYSIFLNLIKERLKSIIRRKYCYQDIYELSRQKTIGINT